ncbi:MAG: hypothetical protein Aureis2KO_08560 [Aureisphaera sp.]
MKDRSINGKYILVAVLAVIGTWIIHEFAHWLTSELLGYESIMRLNGVAPVEGESPTENHKAIISISGPIITVLQGLVFFLLIQRNQWNKYLYPFLFTAFYMRFLAGGMNFIEVNDEGRVSEFLGLGTFTLSIVVSVLLFFMVYRVSRKHQLHWKFQFWTFLITTLAITLLIFSDAYFRIRLL